MGVDPEQTSLMKALRARDEAAFARLVEEYHASLVRLARIFVRDPAIAEEAAQETWLAVLDGLDRFEGRSSLKTWIFSILANKARTSSQREARSLSYTDLEEPSADEPTVDPSRFTPPSAGSSWAAGAEPASWAGVPEEALLAQETMELIRRAIDSLPDAQRLVITLRDLEQL